jgi:hypothetical protein
MYSRANQDELNEGSNNEGTGGSSTVSTTIPQQITVDETSIKIQGLPGIGNGLTALGSLEAFGSGASDEYITRYQSSIYGTINPTAPDAPTKNYGRAARYRMIVADPYDYNKLKRGFGIYYGVRSTAPGASTGYIGDVWISW